MVWRAEEDLDTILERRAVGIETGRHVPEMKPDEYVRAGRVHFGFEVEDAMLSYVVQRWGPDPWLYASDIPHAHRILNATSEVLGRKDLSEEAKRKLLIDNTARFYGLPVA
jgi:predicted TIM-barrel fold metal-dependent hydrolase